MESNKTIAVNFSQVTATSQVLSHPNLLSSHLAGWKGIYLQYYDCPSHETPEHYPTQHVVAIQTRGVIEAERKLGDRFGKEKIQVGDICIVPAYTRHWIHSNENRTRFLLEIVEAVTSVWGNDRVGVRLSPSGTNYSMEDSDRATTFSYVVNALNDFNLAYFHIMEPNEWGTQTGLDARFFRPIFKGVLMVNGEYNRTKGNAVLAKGWADLVSFGRTFLANPDLPKRFELNAPLNEPDPATFYDGDERGYTDYPFLTPESIGNFR
jgi:hypothetical protein